MDDYFSLISRALTDLFTARSNLFVTTAQGWLTASIVLQLIRVGADAALLGKWDGHGFIRLVGKILFVSIVVNGWSTPIALIGGRSASHLVTDEALSLATVLEAGSNQIVQDRLNKAYASIERPTLLSPIVDTIYYFSVVLAMAAFQAVLLGVTSLGYIAMGICVLLGPLFVVTLLWKPLEHLFRNWLSALLQYSFYTVVAAAMAFVLSSVLVSFWALHPGKIQIEDISTVGIQFLVILFVAIYAAFQVPSITSSMFSGKSGEGIITVRSH